MLNHVDKDDNNMNKRRVVYLGFILTLISCTTDESSKYDLSYIGQIVDINICLDDRALTRTESMTTGSAYLISNTSGSVMKRYTWNSELGKFTSENQLIWTAPTMVITGYYINGGNTRPADDFSYTVSPTTQNYCVGQTTANFNSGSPESISIVLKQQLAKVSVTLESTDGSTLSDPKLGGGVLYTSGIFDKSSFGATSYANGGTDGSGWTVASNGTPTTIDMTVASSNTFTAIILPQKITNTSVDFFTVTVTKGSLVHTVGYRLADTQVFKAGYTYNLKVDGVTNTLYLESDIIVEDFNAPDVGDKIDTTTGTVKN